VKNLTLLLAVACLALAAGCARMPTGVTPLKAATGSELRAQVLESKADVDLFRLRGPFEVEIHKDRGLSLSATERVAADWYFAAPAEKAPLVILLHGHDATKDDHGYQAFHLATWGIHSVAVQLPGAGPWVDNGKTLTRIAEAVRRRPELMDSRIDANRILLSGHSFGGAAVSVALAEGAPAAGAILLDPSGLDKDFPKFLGRIDKPVMLVRADERYSPVRGRDDFFFHIRKNIVEFTIPDATHDDAQFPLDAPDDPDSTATDEMQITFVSILTSAALSLAYTGNLDYAWRSFADGIASGRFSNAVRK
jgi:alpha-beta hydrolase superfamily lysophospholipase